MRMREVKGLIIEKLQQLDVYYPDDGGLEHNVRCPFCGDSIKSPEHAHLWIHIDPDTQESMPWYCFRCGARGSVNDEFLDELGILLTKDELDELKAFNKKATKLAAKRGLTNAEKFVAPLSEPSWTTMPKLEYLNDRLGIGFDFFAAKQNKIILSLKDFMAVNELREIPTIDRWQYSVLERDFIGFLSTNNNCITFRNINPDTEQKMRYYKVLINPFSTNEATFYSVPVRVPIMDPVPISIHIAEGTFDILSVKYNLCPPQENALFYASCGYRYTGIVKFIVSCGVCSNLTLHVYADKDKSDYDHRKMIRETPIMEFIDHVYLHRNRFHDQKDYGVSLPFISDKVRQIY